MSHRFLNRPLTVLSADKGVHRKSSQITRTILGERILISRALCHFEVMQAPAGGQGFRATQAALLAAKSRTPITNPDFHFDWREDQIGVWSWDRTLIQSITDFEGEVFPETVLHQPLLNGSRLVQVIDGFEGQLWRDNRLEASRWWPTEPDNTQWALFGRTARMTENEMQLPPLTAPERLGAPISKTPFALRLEQFKAIKTKDAVSLALICMAAPTLFWSVQWVNLTLTKASLSTEVTNLSEQTAEITAARNSAQSAATELRAYDARLNQIHPAETLSEIAVIMADFDIDLFQFEQSGLQFTASVRANSEITPDTVVLALENNALFSNARIEPTTRDQEWVINADLEPNS